jgi:divalent metal cation (Fe/Co/Zn/Cd) transporter
MDNDLEKKGIRLEYAATGFTLMAAIAAFAAGAIADSIALIGFGLNGMTDFISAVVLRRQFFPKQKEQGQEELKSAGTGKPLFAAGIAFFLLALYLLHESGSRLYYGERSATSVGGLVLAVLSLVVTIFLLIMTMRMRAALDADMMRYRTRKTMVRVFFAAILVLGLGLYLRLGLWWADPLAALLLFPVIILQGWEAVEASKKADRSQIKGTNA